METTIGMAAAKEQPPSRTSRSASIPEMNRHLNLLWAELPGADHEGCICCAHVARDVAPPAWFGETSVDLWPLQHRLILLREGSHRLSDETVRCEVRHGPHHAQHHSASHWFVSAEGKELTADRIDAISDLSLFGKCSSAANDPDRSKAFRNGQGAHGCIRATTRKGQYGKVVNAKFFGKCHDICRPIKQAPTCLKIGVVPFQVDLLK